MTTVFNTVNKTLNNEHEEMRQEVYGQIENFWHDLFDEPYALYDIKVFERKIVNEIREVTKRIGIIYDKTAPLLRNLSDESLADLGIPEKAIPFLREKALPMEGVIRRIDLVKTTDGWKHYEINADTPTFIYECHHVNGVVANHLGYEDANNGCEEQLARGVQEAIYYSHKGEGIPKVVFSAHKMYKEEWDKVEEDWNTLAYLQKIAELPKELISDELIPLDELLIQEGVGLFTPSGEKVDILYRQTYPIEHLIDDTSEDGTNIGVELLKLVQEGKLTIINPLSAFLLQSKAIQVLIWGLHEEGHEYFTEEEHEWIENHFIPTYLEHDVFISQNKKFVEKPSFGREGDTIVIYNSDGTPDRVNPLHTYDDSLKIYQEYVELPKEKVMTPYGETEGHLLVGSFLIGTEPGAIGIRVGEKITGNESCFLPIGIK